MVRVSTVIAAYNDAVYIRETLVSALAQSQPPFEIIVVDDGSTDNTEAVVAPFLNEQVHYVRQDNQGVSAARNRRMALVTGDYINFLDADDRLLPHLLETQLAVMETDPGLACSFGNFVRFEDERNRYIGDQFRDFPELNVTPSRDLGIRGALVILGNAFPVIVGWSDFPAFMSTMLFRRSMLTGLHFDRRLVHCQDADFVLRVSMRGRMAYTSQVLAEVRRHARNASRDVGLMPLDKLRALECVAEDPLSAHWRGLLSNRLIRARFDAAKTLVRRRRWSGAAYRVASAIRTPGSYARKAKGTLRVGAMAAEELIVRHARWKG